MKNESFNFKKDNYIIITNSSNYSNIRNKIINELTNKMKLKGVYITFNKPGSTLMNELKNEKIDTLQLYFIDTISKRLIKDTSYWDNLTVTQGPEALTELSIELTKAIHSGIYDFLILDSINAMITYNDPETVKRFIHFLINKSRHLFIKGVFLTLKDNKTENIINNLSIVTDEVINL